MATWRKSPKNCEGNVPLAASVGPALCAPFESQKNHKPFGRFAGTKLLADRFILPERLFPETDVLPVREELLRSVWKRDAFIAKEEEGLESNQ